jgi:hypothetical protein
MVLSQHSHKGAKKHHNKSATIDGLQVRYEPQTTMMTKRILFSEMSEIGPTPTWRQYPKARSLMTKNQPWTLKISYYIRACHAKYAGVFYVLHPKSCMHSSNDILIWPSYISKQIIWAVNMHTFRRYISTFSSPSVVSTHGRHAGIINCTEIKRASAQHPVMVWWW